MSRTIPVAAHELCLAFPETKETSSHGSPDFKVKGKSFAYFVSNHHGDGRVGFWLRSPPGVQELYVQMNPQAYFVPPYLGKSGWLGVDLNQGLSWTEVTARVHEAWVHRAPAALAQSLEGAPEVAPPEIAMSLEDIDPLLGARPQEVLAELRTLCDRLPETSHKKESGQIVWRAGKKPFARLRCGNGRTRLMVRVGVENQSLYAQDSRYHLPMYYASSGWIDLDLQNSLIEEEVTALLEGSYRQVALKRMLKVLDG